MTKEENQALIDWLEEGVACSDEYGFSGNILKSMKIALAALTAPAVKLPKKEKALIGRDYLYVYCAGPVESAIRAAGCEVQE